MRAHSALYLLLFLVRIAIEFSLWSPASIFLIYKIEKSIKENKNPLLVCLFIISYHH